MSNIEELIIRRKKENIVLNVIIIIICLISLIFFGNDFEKVLNNDYFGFKLLDEGNYDIIECNTPVASVLTRMATKKTRKQNNTRVIYIAHGFHFYKGAPLINWLTFYPVEKHLSKYTDDLITINEEDFEFAKDKMKAKRVHHIHGIGVNEEKFSKEVSMAEREELREKLKLHDNDFVLFFAG